MKCEPYYCHSRLFAHVGSCKWYYPVKDGPQSVFKTEKGKHKSFLFLHKPQKTVNLINYPNNKDYKTYPHHWTFKEKIDTVHFSLPEKEKVLFLPVY